MACTAKKQIEYAGEEIPGVTIYWDVNTALSAGEYTVELFADNYRLASRRFTIQEMNLEALQHFYEAVNSVEVTTTSAVFKLCAKPVPRQLRRDGAQAQRTDRRYTHIRPHLHGSHAGYAALDLCAAGIPGAEKRRPRTYRRAGDHRHRLSRRRSHNTDERLRCADSPPPPASGWWPR